MVDIVKESWETYQSNLKLALLFSIPFIIAFVVPLLAPLPTYVSIGGIFLRSASIFINLNPFNLGIILVSTFFSLLFMSLAFVLISFIVKTLKTHVKISRRAFQDIEKYVGRVFIVLLAYTVLLLVANILGYYIGMEALVTSVIGFLGFMLIFYAPSAIVVDNKGIVRSMRDSAALVIHDPQYFLLWFVLITIVISILDFVIIAATGTFFSRYIILILNSIVVLPYFVIFQAEAYMRRFKLLKH